MENINAVNIEHETPLISVSDMPIIIIFKGISKVKYNKFCCISVSPLNSFNTFKKHTTTKSIIVLKIKNIPKNFARDNKLLYLNPSRNNMVPPKKKKSINY